MDRYTRIVLTVIALALVWLAMRPLILPAPASAQFAGCGDSRNPCYVSGGLGGLAVTNADNLGLKVWIVR